MAKKVEEAEKEIKNENIAKQEEKNENNIPPTPQNAKSKLWILIVIICVLVLGVGAVVTYFVTDGFDFSSSSSSKSDSDKEDKKDKDKEEDNRDKDAENKDKDEDKEKQDELLSLDNYEILTSLNDNIIIKAYYTNSTGKHSMDYFVLDKDLKIVNKIKNYENYTWKDGFALVKESDTSYVIDYNGNKVWNAKNSDYLEIQLSNNGHLVLSRQVDTYNTSEKQAGIYDIKLKKMVLDFSKEYYDSDFEEEDKVLIIDDYTIFNTKLNKLIKFENEHGSNFESGYSTNRVYINNNNKRDFVVSTDTGEQKVISLPEDSNLDCSIHKNGLCLDLANVYRVGQEENYTYIVDFKAGTVKEVGTDYYRINNDVIFNKNGYALLIFENSGGVQYYTVINNNAERMFEPVRVNDETTKLSISLYDAINDENCFIVSDDNKRIVVNYKNEVVAKPQDNETFDRLIGNYILVKNNGNTYLKDLKGKIVNITIEK